jgi:Flp pilus assembly pilin Flp
MTTFEPDTTTPLLGDLLADDAGASTAEYAIVTMAAVAFAGVLVVIMRSGEVREILTDLVRRALSVA